MTSLTRMLLSAVCFASLVSLSAQPGAYAEELTEARFRKIHKALQPGEKPWRTIPWKIGLLDAQKTAAREAKPIFIWAMDGHPLGCT